MFMFLLRKKQKLTMRGGFKFEKQNCFVKIRRCSEFCIFALAFSYVFYWEFE